MQKPVDMPLLTPREAAKLLNLPTNTVRKMIERKELLAYKIGRRWRIPQPEVAKLKPRSQ